MAFVADDLGAWLVGKLADAGGQRLITWMLGSEQERALRQAATAAVQLTAVEFRPEHDDEAEELAMVVSQVFGEPVVDVPRIGHATLLQAVQAGIARQLAVLDDAGLTGTGLSSADVLGISASVLADRLADHIVREIKLRGSRGGPLKPLADQLNHDETRLQGQLIKDTLDRIAGELRGAPTRPENLVSVAGRPLHEVADPFALEVHRPVQPEDLPPGLPPLPPYVSREHDAELESVAHAAAEGRSRIAVLVGGSSTGKTRACWEVLRLLRGRQPGWRLWHPIDPSRPQAALRELPAIGPRTVVWLNEAQFYLDAADLGERVAAGLRELLRDQARAPVLVLATLWPQFWDILTARPGAGGTDPHSQARELLTGQDITVPAAFTAAQVLDLTKAADPRLVQAAAGSRDGQVIQFLAGAPELLARYRNAPPAAAALISAAIDARRLGMGMALPLAFLEAAAPAYLTDAEWDGLGEVWLEQALAYAAAPCKGTRGPLARIRPRPRHPGDLPSGPVYRLADYIDQHGRRARRRQIPPRGFWTASADFADPRDLAALAQAAENRGMLQNAARLYKRAVVHGDAHAAANLIRLLHLLHPADQNPARWAVVHTALDDPSAVADLLNTVQKAGADEQVIALLARDPAAHVVVGNPYSVVVLLGALREAGAHEQATMLARRAAAWIPLDNPDAVARLLIALRDAGASEQITALLARDPAAHTVPERVFQLLDRLWSDQADDLVRELADRAATLASLEDPDAVARLLSMLRMAGADEHATALLARDPAGHAALDDPDAVTALLRALRKAGADDQATTLARRAAAHTPLNGPAAVFLLLAELQQAGADEQVKTLADRAARHDPDLVTWMLEMLSGGPEELARSLADRAVVDFPLHEPKAVAQLLEALRKTGSGEPIRALLARAPATHAALDDPDAVTALLRALRKAGADEQATTLARRAAAHAPLKDTRAIAETLKMLREEGADEQVAALLARDPAGHAELDRPGDAAWLLAELQRAGADEQLTTLARRAAAHTPLDHPETAWLLDELRKAGADEQVAALLARDPAGHTALANPGAVAALLETLLEVGADEQVARLLARDPAAHVVVGDPYSAAALLDALQKAGAGEQVKILADRAAAHAAVDNPYVVGLLLDGLRKAGADEQVKVLADRVAVRAVDNPWAGRLVHKLREVGADEQVATLLAGAAAHAAALGEYDTVYSMLSELRLAGTDQQVKALADRVAAHAALDKPYVADLLDHLRGQGMDEQVKILADRAAHGPLEDPSRVGTLLDALRRAGANEQVTALGDRLPSVGMFVLFLTFDLHEKQYRFGREPDGRPAQPWGWDDLN